MSSPPRFWSAPPDAPGLAARVLSPLGALYGAATARRVAQPGASVGVPVICVGNINAGGTGKTPTVIEIIQRLTARGVAAQVISRGYGGSNKDTRKVSTSDDAAVVGDEPLLLSAFASTWVGPDRLALARAAVADGAQAIVMDDGFQNPALAKDLSLVIVDAQAGFGNGRVIPAGPLREPVAAGLARADLLLSIGDSSAQTAFHDLWGHAIHLPHLTGALEPLPTGMPWAGLRAFAFAGIGRPAKFFETLRGLGAEIVGQRPLDDHQPLSSALLQRLTAEAQAANAQLVTTEKDAVRLPASYRASVLTLPVRLQIADATPLDAALDRIGL
ncbi:Tetraacyldisaccharide 4'-kinase [Rhodobacteraceae bacterium THAF1]|uniref:tetraacyldisaccharide 4'-kinase n=1 Tax=Palleronia sp. THAF1 TaxID=2587842 RepID=UPI000F3E8350|nr:tetraacyldisaccharide 4'-kinase [Palleronia sp. THAF1]QFU10033.1 Tetraacyldisaccharide 4'-kinase [Palleronia sp. THAF1]VDC17062.1 Tetraacyldisaccharide 4'-kinase [Rhodobacteraceae bacterium THAF1]